MSQRTRILAEILGFSGWRVTEVIFENDAGTPIVLTANGHPQPSTRLVLRVERKWTAVCSTCDALCSKDHGRLTPRRWQDLPWAQHPVVIEASPVRVRCKGCKRTPVELLPWAEPHQRQTRRLQQTLARQAASMPIMHVAALHGLDWHPVRRAGGAALARWDASRTPPPLHMVLLFRQPWNGADGAYPWLTG